MVRARGYPPPRHFRQGDYRGQMNHSNRIDRNYPVRPTLCRLLADARCFWRGPRLTTDAARHRRRTHARWRPARDPQVERILVRPRQGAGSLSMTNRDRQANEALRLDSARQVPGDRVRARKLSQSMLRRNFPARRSANKDGVCVLANGGACSCAQALVAGQPPEK